MVDIVLLLTLFSMATMAVMYHRDGLMFPKQFLIIVMTITVLIPPGYVLYLIFGQSLAKGWQYGKTFLLKRMKRFRCEMDSEDQTLLDEADNASAMIQN